jgi:hypothetical protein
MKSLLLFKRFHLFVSHDPFSWVGWWLRKDYHNVICTITFLTFEIGFEYVWKTEKEVKKICYGWSLIKG